jgi:hypothetical protein
MRRTSAIIAVPAPQQLILSFQSTEIKLPRRKEKKKGDVDETKEEEVIATGAALVYLPNIERAAAAAALAVYSLDCMFLLL